jgi:hypothetical protein
VVDDPSAPGYDPTVLKMAMQVPVSAIFAREPRDPSWAPAVEKYLSRTLETDLRSVLPHAKFTFQTECKFSTCMAQITFPDDLTETEQRAAAIVSQYSGIGDATEVKNSGKTMTLEMAIARDNREPGAMRETRASRRDQWVARLASLPQERLPPEERELEAILRRIPRADNEVP